jgi:hydrogenase maturation protease
VSAPRVLVIGYGNPSRGDDAIGPELIRLLEEEQANRPDWFHVGLLTDFQLQVEHAADLLDCDLALFADACADCPAPCRLSRLEPARDHSYTSHAMSPAAVLWAFAEAYGRAPPPAYLLAVAGEQFALGAPMTAPAQANLAAARALAVRLLDHPRPERWESALG